MVTESRDEFDQASDSSAPASPVGSAIGQLPDFGLHEELQMYRDLFERLPLAAYIKDRDARFVDVNPFHAKAIGVERQEMVGRADSDFYPDAEARLYRSADERVMSDGVPLSGLTDTHTGFNGSVVQQKTWKFPVRNRRGDIVGLMGFTSEHSESSGALEELKRSEIRYALATRASRDGIFEFNVEQATVLMSAQASQLLTLPITNEPIPWESVAELLSFQDELRLQRKLTEMFRNPNETVDLQVQIVADDRPRWLQVRFTAFTEMDQITSLIGSIADVTESRERLAQLDFYAHHDSLTSLGNRRALQRKLGSTLAQIQSGEINSEQRRLSLLCLDLDSFKMINDSLGHLAGDAMLHLVSERLQRFAQELSGMCMVARYGGDEFALVIEGMPEAEVELFAHSLTRRLKEPTTIFGLEVYPSASVGVVHVRDQVDATDVLRDADIAMYQAKAKGKARATVFHPGMRDEAQAVLNAQTRIRRAVDNGKFVLVYQPVIHGRTGSVAGFEALIRLQGPNAEMVRPALFLEYLEQSDLILEVGRWVVEQAVQQLAVWRAQYPELGDVTVGVNVSRRQFADDGLFEFIATILRENNVPASALVLEITETAVVHDGVDLEALQRFRNSGGLVAIDDFGTGESSLFALNELPVDILKLDRSFTARIGPNGVDQMLEATFDFVRSLDVVLVAEGVEEPYHAKWLQQRGTHYLQGYHFAKPMTEADVHRYLAARRDANLPEAA